MPDHIRALVVILFFSTVFFAFAKKPACDIIRSSDFTRRRNLWLVITLTAFVVQDIWIYFLIVGTLLVFARANEPNPVALFFILLFVVPFFEVQIPGLGLVNYLFSLSHQRLLSLVILLPAFLALIGQKQALPFGRTIPDKLIAAYIILIIILYFRGSTITDTLRIGFYQFIDIFLPYYVISRFLKDTQAFRGALLCFVIAVMILALIGSFEALKNWLLYDSMKYVLGIQDRSIGYGTRAGFQRAYASVGTIPLGYVTTVAIGFLLFLQRSINLRINYRIGQMLLLIGLLAALSRGPWVGAIFLYLVFVVTGSRPVRALVTLGIVGLVALPLITILPGTEKIIDLLPYIGKSEQLNISYREELIKNSLVVINRHPFFGSINYLDTPEMESMRQGGGIIDIVNTYIGITLERGYIGLSLFAGFFMTICWGIYRSFRSLQDKNSEEYLLGRSLLAILSSILLIIFTVSSVSIIPIVYWSVAGLGAAYINMINRLRSSQNYIDKHLA